MRVRIAEGRFEGQCGEASSDMKSWDWWVRLDILSDYPMRFSEREFIRISASDGVKHIADRACHPT